MKSFVRRTVVSLAAAGALALAGNGVAMADENSIDENATSTSTAGSEVSDAGFDKSPTGGKGGGEDNGGGGGGEDDEGGDEDDNDGLFDGLLSNLLGGDDDEDGDDD